MERTQEENYKREAPFKRSPTLRYEDIFIGLCYSCNIFENKDIKCRAYAKNISNYEGYSRINHLKSLVQHITKTITILAH
jgi:hypothetical protein